MGKSTQMFKPGITLSPETSAPVTFTGTNYYDSTRNSFRFRINGNWVDTASQSAVTSDTNLDSTNFTADVVSSSFVRVSGQTVARDIFGITATSAGKVIILSNAGTVTLTIKNESGSEGTAANRITTDTGNDVTLVAGNSATFIYDTTSSRWRLLNSGIGAFVNGGNSFGTTASIGTNDAFSLILKTNNTTALTIDASQLATFVGSVTATRFIPSGSTVATNGLYLPAANTLGLSTNSVARWYINSSGYLIGQQTDNRIYTTADTASLLLGGGSSASNPANGAIVELQGNTAGGALNLYSGPAGTIKGYINATLAFTVNNDASTTFTGMVTASRFVPSGSTIAQTGIYLPAANTIGFSTASTAQWYINSSGNFIGQRSSNDIYIASVISGDYLRLSGSNAPGDSSQGAYIQLNPTASNLNAVDGDLTLASGNSSNGDINFRTGGSLQWYINNSGELKGNSSTNNIIGRNSASNQNGNIQIYGSDSQANGAFIGLYGVTQGGGIDYRIATSGGASPYHSFYTGASGTLALQITDTQRILIADGSVSSPAFAYISDSDTGEYRSGANEISWATGGGRVLTLTSDRRILASSAINRALGTSADARDTSLHYIESGTYTPTGTAVANVGAPSAISAYWMRVGKVVTVTGEFTATGTTAGTLTQVRLTVPIGSDFGTNTEAGGSVWKRGDGTNLGAIDPNNANDAVIASWILGAADGGSSRTFGFQFTYYIN